MNLEKFKARLLALDTSAVCDANKGLRVLDPGIHPIRSGLKMVGVARTVKCQEDFLAVIKALSDFVAGEILVVDSMNSKSALAGELFRTEAARRGLASSYRRFLRLARRLFRLVSFELLSSSRSVPSSTHAARSLEF